MQEKKIKIKKTIKSCILFVFTFQNKNINNLFLSPETIWKGARPMQSRLAGQKQINVMFIYWNASSNTAAAFDY